MKLQLALHSHRLPYERFYAVKEFWRALQSLVLTCRGPTLACTVIERQMRNATAKAVAAPCSRGRKCKSSERPVRISLSKFESSRISKPVKESGGISCASGKLALRITRASGGWVMDRWWMGEIEWALDRGQICGRWVGDGRQMGARQVADMRHLCSRWVADRRWIGGG